MKNHSLTFTIDPLKLVLWICSTYLVMVPTWRKDPCGLGRQNFLKTPSEYHKINFFAHSAHFKNNVLLSLSLRRESWIPTVMSVPSFFILEFRQGRLCLKLQEAFWYMPTKKTAAYPGLFNSVFYTLSILWTWVMKPYNNICTKD